MRVWVRTALACVALLLPWAARACPANGFAFNVVVKGYMTDLREHPLVTLAKDRNMVISEVAFTPMPGSFAALKVATADGKGKDYYLRDGFPSP